MSITAISPSPISHRPVSHQPGQASASRAASDIANTGSVSNDAMAAFSKSLSTSLQTTINKTPQIAANHPMARLPHQHHPSVEGGDNLPATPPPRMNAALGEAHRAYGATLGLVT